MSEDIATTLALLRAARRQRDREAIARLDADRERLVRAEAQERHEAATERARKAADTRRQQKEG